MAGGHVCVRETKHENTKQAITPHQPKDQIVNKPADRKPKRAWTIILVVLLVVSSISVFSIGYLLRRGVSKDTITLGQVTVSGFFAQWKDRLQIDVASVVYHQHDSQPQSSVNLNSIARTIQTARYFAPLFSHVSIETITVGNLIGSLHLNSKTNDTPSFFTLKSDDVDIRANLSINHDVLTASITKAVSQRFQSFATGEIRFTSGQKSVTGSLSGNLAGSLPVMLNFTADTNGISFHGKEAGKIETITPFIDLFGLDKNIQRWITEYLTGSRFILTTFRGEIEWQNPKAILDTLYAEVTVDDCEYTFAQGINPVQAPKTDLVFDKGILTIFPRNATLYQQGLQKSWLAIDFNAPQDIILSLHIKTLATLNDNILKTLNHYHISLPFKQTKGQTSTDLTLIINLNKREVTSSATFGIDTADIEYNKKIYTLTNTSISLENASVTVKGTLALNALFVADLDGTIDLKKQKGDLDFLVKQLAFKVGASDLQLDSTEKDLHVQLHIQPTKDTLVVSPSSWKLDDLQIHLASFTTSFSTADPSLFIPPTQLTTASGTKADISGSVLIKKKQVALQCRLFEYKAGDIQLKDSDVLIGIQYNNGLVIETKKVSHWKVNNIATTLYPSEFTYNNSILTVLDGRISYGVFFDSSLSGYYNRELQQGELLLKDLYIKKKEIHFLVGDSTSIPVQIHHKNKRLFITVPDLGLTINAGGDKGWSATFNDLATIYSKSAFLQKFKIQNGSLALSSKDGKKPYEFTVSIPHFYPFLIHDNNPISGINISGTMSETDITATINDLLHVRYDGQLTITSNDLKYNVPEITRFLKKQSTKSSSTTSDKKLPVITFNASNSALFFKEGSEAPADLLHFTYADKKASMRLDHGDGSIVFDIEGTNFSFKGKEINSVFMGALIDGAQFENGQMNLAAQGSFDNFSILFKIEDTLLTKFSIMNNILAFLNTIPALITLSLPEFNRKGLPIQSAVIGMIVQNGIATIESFTLDSPEMTIAGNGNVDFPKNTIDMDFNIITQAKTNIGKIPLLGFILVGKKKRPSLTINISGDLQNPDVHNSAFKDVVSLPFNILFRTLSLPFHLVDSMTDSAQNDKSELKFNSGSMQ